MRAGGELDVGDAPADVGGDVHLMHGGEVADRVAEYRRHICELVAGSMLAQLPQQRRDAARVEIEALSTALLGAAEALARWWLRTEALSADAARRVVEAAPHAVANSAANASSGSVPCVFRYCFVADHVQGVVIANSGHWLMEGQPAATMAALEQFIDAKP